MRNAPFNGHLYSGGGVQGMYTPTQLHAGIHTPAQLHAGIRPPCTDRHL